MLILELELNFNWVELRASKFSTERSFPIIVRRISLLFSGGIVCGERLLFKRIYVLES